MTAPIEALIHPNAQIHPTARLGYNVTVNANAIIGEAVVIGDGCSIGSGAVIYPGTVIGRNNRVFSGAILGQEPQDLKYRGEATTLEIGDHNTIREYVTISRGTAGGGGVTRIGSHNLFMAYVHVGHDDQIGSHVIIANGCQLAGHVVIEDGVVMGGLAGMHQFTRIGRLAMVGAFSKVVKDIPPFVLAEGIPATARGINVVGLRRGGMSAAARMEVHTAYRLLYRSGLNVSQAVEQLLADEGRCEQVSQMVAFIQQAQRGICRAASRDEEADAE